jgi:hypothetical protein
MTNRLEPQTRIIPIEQIATPAPAIVDEHLALMKQRKQRAKANRDRKYGTGIDRKLHTQAWLKVRRVRWAIALATLNWKIRVINLLAAYEHCHGQDQAREYAWTLFRMRWPLRRHRRSPHND